MMNLVQRLRMENRLEVYWDDALTPSLDNPFPLAPPDAIRAGKVTDESYKKQNRRLEVKSQAVMLPQLLKLRARPDFREGVDSIVVVGAGLMRDVQWIANAVILGFQVAICDASDVACGNARKFVDEHKVDDVRIIHADIESAWGDNEIDEECVRAYYCGQLVQNLDVDTKDRVMQHFGDFLQVPGKLGRRVYLLHARGEDNPSSEVEWRNTTPYGDEELRTPLEIGFGGPVTMEAIGQHRHWNQRYTWLKIKRPGV